MLQSCIKHRKDCRKVIQLCIAYAQRFFVILKVFLPLASQDMLHAWLQANICQWAYTHVMICCSLTRVWPTSHVSEEQKWRATDSFKGRINTDIFKNVSDMVWKHQKPGCTCRRPWVQKTTRHMHKHNKTKQKNPTEPILVQNRKDLCELHKGEPTHSARLSHPPKCSSRSNKLNRVHNHNSIWLKSSPAGVQGYAFQLLQLVPLNLTTFQQPCPGRISMHWL